MRRFLLFLIFCIQFTPSLGAEAVTQTLLIVGDSLTEGYGVEKAAAYPARLEELFKKNKISIRVINAGSSGSTTASAEARLKWHLQKKPDFVMIALGANDGLRGFAAESSYQNLKKALELAKKNSIRVILAGMFLPKNYGDQYRAEFEGIFKKLVKEYDVIFIPFLLEGVGGVPEFNLADGIHPNEKGYARVAEHVFRSLKGKL